MSDARESTDLVVTAERKPRRGDEVVVRIEGFDERGRGFATLRGMRLHVRHALPGDLVRVFVLRRMRTEVEAHLKERLEASPAAATPRCAHFGSCGGCSFQNLAYAAQLEGLHALVEGAFRARNLLGDLAVEPVLGAADPWRYRNKMEFTFGDRRWIDPREPPDAPADFALGLHAAQLYGKVIDVGSCSIQSSSADAILASVRTLAREHALLPWSVHAHTGLLRHLALRTARATGEIMVNLVTSRLEEPAIDALCAALVRRHPEITTVVQTVNARKAATTIGDFERVVHGPGFICEQLGDLVFAISAGSFFQTNTAQAEALFELVREECALKGTEIVYDLYCGTGSIALSLAGQAREVVGFEQVSSAIADARRNAELNAITNARFVEGDVLAALAERDPEAKRPDVCVVDPPRAGLHPKLIPRLSELAPRRIVYVSCNPRAAAQDVERLLPAGYRLARIRPIDLFPHTPHVECVIRLERVGATPNEGRDV